MTFFKKIALTLFFLSLFMGGSQANAGTHPFNASLVPDVAVFKKGEKIHGFMLNLWGENELHGMALGIVNGTRGESLGFTFGVLNYADTFTGGQVGAFNWAKKEMIGFQGGIANYAEKLRGVQIGIINYAGSGNNAIQLGVICLMPQTKTFFAEFPYAVSPAFVVFNWRFR